MSDTHTLFTRDVTDTEDLRTIIDEAADAADADNPDGTNIIDIVCGAVGSARTASLVRNTLTDGSHTYDLVLR
jgi:hypothetical protein